MIGQHAGQGEKVLWGSPVSLGIEDRAFHWEGGSVPTALKSVPARAAEIIYSLRDLGFEGQYLPPNDSLQLSSSWLQLLRLFQPA